MSTTDKPSHIKFNLQSFSDEEIEKLLEQSNFRHLSPATRDKYLLEMQMDRWDSGNGECLAFSEGGDLLNGQHRLSAALTYQRETGKRIWFWCARNVQPKSAFRMDTGKMRSLVEYLRNE